MKATYQYEIVFEFSVELERLAFGYDIGLWESDALKRKQAKSSRLVSDRYWLVKSEPHVFSIDDLIDAPKQRTCWDGVRNYQARNFLRDDMKLGDYVLFYHSNAKLTGVAGIAKVAREGYPDHTAWDEKDPHYDPKSKKDSPTWIMIDVEFVEKFTEVVPLAELRTVPALRAMALLQKGSRLSVQPVRPDEFDCIVAMGRQYATS